MIFFKIFSIVVLSLMGLAIIVIVVFMYLFFGTGGNNYHKTYKIISSNGTYFVHAYSIGFRTTRDYIIINEKPDIPDTADTANNIIFPHERNLFYKTTNDSILIYSNIRDVIIPSKYKTIFYPIFIDKFEFNNLIKNYKAHKVTGIKYAGLRDE